MKLAIYRLKENEKICRVHKVKDVFIGECLEEAVRDYNREIENEDTVEIVEIDEGSLEMFLYNRSEMDIKMYRSEIENMVGVMWQLEKSLDWLCNEAKGAN